MGAAENSTRKTPTPRVPAGVIDAPARHARSWIRGIFGRRSVPALLCFGVSAAAYSFVFLRVPEESALFTGGLVTIAHRSGVAALVLIALVVLGSGRENTFLSAASLLAAVSLVLVAAFRQTEGTLVLLVLAGILPLGVYEPFPLSLALCTAYLALCVGAAAVAGVYEPEGIARLGLVGITSGILVSLMGHYREDMIALQRYVNRLEENVSALTRANSLSQDYARGVEEESRAAERQRLTRDIHDAIGYTLTNTIMVMEAVKMMVRTEPERVSGYLEVARQNTEEGLATIKRILSDFRSTAASEESCFRAIRKLVKVFQLSTGLAVRYEFGNLKTAVLDRNAECVYHFVQEGLINAFRHGRASRVTLLFWDYGDSVRLSLDDDGAGCPEPPVAGIGIAGMCERASLAGGRVEVDRHVRGFRISMYLPRNGRNGDQGRGNDSAAHRG
jgi:signal transduction histidine kinase